MKKTVSRAVTMAAFAALLLLTGCVGKTKLGRCVGLNGAKDSALVYEYSTRNIVLGIVGIEFVAPPVWVALNALECPVAKVALPPTGEKSLS